MTRTTKLTLVAITLYVTMGLALVGYMVVKGIELA